MYTSTLFVLLLAFSAQLQTNAQNLTVEEALENSKTALITVKSALEDKLPANTEARAVGDEILVALERGLKLCDEQFLKDKSLVTYVTCVASNKGLAMASLGEVAGQQWAKSGASRPGLFC